MKLNLGSGLLGKSSPWSGDDWLNMDFAAFEADKGDWSLAKYLDWDMGQLPWPIESDSVDCIFASHVFEHFRLEKLTDLLKECQRVLKIGAPIRIICPDPRKFITNWQLENSQFVLECYGEQNWDRWNYGENLNIGFTDMFFPAHYDHQSIPCIDYYMIILIRLGFSKVYEMDYSVTKFPAYFGRASNNDGVCTSMDNRPCLSWYLEVVK